MQEVFSTHIVKPTRSTPAMVQRSLNGQNQTAINWSQLATEAMAAIEPELRRRWTSYWESLERLSPIARNATDAREMMAVPPRPSAYYACPAEIAARAIWPTTCTSSLPMIEASVEK